MVRMVVRVPRSGGDARVLAASELTDIYVKRQKRLGDFAYEIVDGGRVLETGVFPGEPFETRGEGPGKEMRAAKIEEATAVTLYIPDVTIASLQLPSSKVSINFYRLKPVTGLGPDVTPAAFSRLKADATPAGTLSVSNLKEFLAKSAKRDR